MCEIFKKVILSLLFVSLLICQIGDVSYSQFQDFQRRERYVADTTSFGPSSWKIKRNGPDSLIIKDRDGVPVMRFIHTPGTKHADGRDSIYTDNFVEILQLSILDTLRVDTIASLTEGGDINVIGSVSWIDANFTVDTVTTIIIEYADSLQFSNGTSIQATLADTGFTMDSLHVQRINLQYEATDTTNAPIGAIVFYNDSLWFKGGDALGNSWVNLGR